MVEERRIRWQPVVVVLNGRLECQCGNLAIFVTGKIVQAKYNALEEVDCWCQSCFEKAQDDGRFLGGTETE